MTIKIGINGFGRMGRLALRAAWDWPELEFVHINEPAGDIATAAHLLKYDSVHRTWPHDVSVDGDSIVIDGKAITYSQNTELAASPWVSCEVDLLIECSGKFKSKQALAPLLTPLDKEKGIKKIVVSAPIKDGTLNIVMGVNDHLYRAQEHHRSTVWPR